MDLQVPDSAVEFGSSVRRSLSNAGGAALCREATAEPGRRDDVERLLSRLGVWDLDPLADLEQAFAAAAAVRAAGEVAVPYPIVARLLSSGGPWLGVTAHRRGMLRIEHGDLAESWVVARLDGGASTSGRLQRRPRAALAPFVAEGNHGPTTTPVADIMVANWLTLDAFWLLGAAESALRLTVEHTSSRIQFDRPLAAFQAIRLRVAECTTLVRGLRELCAYTLWRHFAEPSDALTDALGVRCVALEATAAVFAATHQFHGAVGLSSEHDVTLLHRHVQGHVRLPIDRDDLSRLLVDRIDQFGFESLFGRFEHPMVGGAPNG